MLLQHLIKFKNIFAKQEAKIFEMKASNHNSQAVNTLLKRILKINWL
jgi:hypothetical protein